LVFRECDFCRLLNSAFGRSLLRAAGPLRISGSLAFLTVFDFFELLEFVTPPRFPVLGFMTRKALRPFIFILLLFQKVPQKLFSIYDEWFSLENLINVSFSSHPENFRE